jgi:hypothetical protein
MDDDLEAFMSIPWELEGERCSSNIDEELALSMKKPGRRVFSRFLSLKK